MNNACTRFTSQKNEETDTYEEDVLATNSIQSTASKDASISQSVSL